MLGKGRDQGWDEYGRIQEDLHGCRGICAGSARARCLFGNSCVALGSLLPLISKLLYDIEVFIRESSLVDQEIPFLLEGWLLSLRTERD